MTETLKGFSPEIAVADAMMYVQATFIQQVRDAHGDEALSVDVLEERLAQQTLGRCKEGSALSIFYLLKNFPSKFDNLTLLVGHGPFTYNPKHLWHTYFLARDVGKGFWYSASPANHTPNSTKSHLTTLHSSLTLNEILKQIREKNGGEWPNPDSIKNALEDYSPPSILNTPAGSTYIDIFTLNENYRRKVMDWKTGKTSFYDKIFKQERYQIAYRYPRRAFSSV